jgi:hypothetical protein
MTAGVAPQSNVARLNEYLPRRKPEDRLESTMLFCIPSLCLFICGQDFLLFGEQQG